MVRFGTLLLDGSPRIAVPFRDGADAAFIGGAARLGADIAELRIDRFKSWDTAYVLREVEKFRTLPILATIRCAPEGGSWSTSEDERLGLYRAVLPLVDAVDVEVSSKAIVRDVVSAAHAIGKPVVLSFHDFTKTPALDVLNGVASQARNLGGDIVKVAAKCNDRADIHTLTRFTLDNVEHGVVSIGMGPLGVSTRLLFPALGSLFTFAAYGEGTAPGQPQLEDITKIFARIYA